MVDGCRNSSFSPQTLLPAALHRVAADGAATQQQRDPYVAPRPAPPPRRPAAGRVPPLARLPHPEAGAAGTVAAAQDEDLCRQRAQGAASSVGTEPTVAGRLFGRQQVQS